MMTAEAAPTELGDDPALQSSMGWLTERTVMSLWTAVAVACFTASMALAYRPTLDSPTDVVLSVLPWPTFLATLYVFTQPERLDWSMLGARLVALACWSVLVINDDTWSVYTFAIYAVCLGASPKVGIALAAVATVAWSSSYLLSDVSAWVVTIPIGVFTVSSVLGLALHSSTDLNEAQADLIRQLTETRRELATVERSKGMLEERARFAAEIHDTLAQGFTSIVLLSRAAQRSGDGVDRLAAIESTALDNLEAARRLIEAVRPAELDSASLPDALGRQVDQALPSEIASEFRVVGHPRRLTGAVEVTLLRATQEALLNIRTHSQAERVDVTLSYLDDVVALDIRDDGIGFTPGAVSDRGELTGGQGLHILEQRARALAGELTIEANDGGGSVVSVLLPVAAS